MQAVDVVDIVQLNRQCVHPQTERKVRRHGSEKRIGDREMIVTGIRTHKLANGMRPYALALGNNSRKCLRSRPFNNLQTVFCCVGIGEGADLAGKVQARYVQDQRTWLLCGKRTGSFCTSEGRPYHVV